MRWYFDLRLGAKLLLAFYTVIALVVVQGAVSIHRLGVVSDQALEVSDVWMTSIEHIETVSKAISHHRLHEFRALTAGTEAERDEAEAMMKEARATIDAVDARYVPLIRTDQGRALHAGLADTWAEYVAISDDLLALQRQGLISEANALIHGESSDVFERAEEAARAATQHQVANGHAAGDEGRSISATARMALLVMTVLIALIAGLMAWAIARLITRPVQRMAEAVRGLALGDLDHDLKAEGKDEIAQLAHSLDEVIASQKILAATALQVAAGDRRAEVEPRSDKDELGRSLKQLLSVLGGLLDEGGALTSAAREGRLSYRANAKRFEGTWRDLMQGINDTLDATTAPVMEASSVLERLAARDLTARAKGSYDGDHARIKDALNRAADNLEDALREVRESTGQVAIAADQISQGSQTLAQGSSEQASSLQEVSSSLQELTSMAHQNTGNAREAQGLADNARASARKGVEQMQSLSQAMQKIQASSDATAKIVKTIDEIAFQTNLLALNAAVEAARAGAAGKGFAVVAEEVRTLAQRSAEAARNTSGLIEESVRNAESGAALNGEALSQLGEIAGHIDRVGEVMHEIAAGSEQQSDGVEQINGAIEQMNTMTQAMASNSEESASAAEELSSQAGRMRELVDGFKLRGGEAAKANRPAAVRPTATTTAAAKTTVKPAATRPARPTSGGRPARRKTNDRSPAQAQQIAATARQLIPFDDDDDASVLNDF
jgi:methyl-accepting chemotaxis protein